MKIRNILLICFVCTGILPLFLFGFYIRGFVGDIVLEKLDGESYATLEKADKILTLSMYVFENSIERLVSDEDVLAFVEGAADASLLSGKFSELISKNPIIGGILIFDKNGKAYAYNLNYDSAYSYIDFAVQTQISNNGYTILEDAYFLGKNRTLIYSVSVGHGHLVMILSDDYLMGTLYSNVENSYLSVYDDGLLLFGFENKNLPYSLEELSIDEVNTIHSQPYGKLSLFNNNVRTEFFFRNSTSNNWMYALNIPYDVFIADVRNVQSVQNIIMVLMMVIIIAIVLCVVLAVTKPIEKLTKRLSDISFPPVPSTNKIHSGIREISQMIKQFDIMTENIADLYKKNIAEIESKRKSDLLALQYQISPHFLYNALSAIRIKALSNKDTQTAKALEIMSRLLRNTLKQTGEKICIENEIKNIFDFLDIMKIRYNNKFKVVFNNDDLMEYSVPSMLLQPIIENALKHGLSQKISSGDGEAIIYIDIKERESHIVFSVTDNGIGADVSSLDFSNGGLSDEDGTYIGLYNVKKRLALHYGDDAKIEISSEPNSYFKVEISIPKEKNSE